MTAGAFTGLTVVEFGQFVVVPFCAQLMSDFGARVIKVEPLSGDSYRSGHGQLADGFTRQFLIKNRGKESIALDLSSPDVRAVVQELIRQADVVLVNLSPSAIERRGLDYQTLREINPAIIYATVSAFGHTGSEAQLPGMDVVVQARSGLMTTLGAERDEVPLHSEAQVADYSTSLLLFGGVAAALYARTVTGLGQKVETSLLAGALAIQNNSLGHALHEDGWRAEFVDDVLPRLRREHADRDDILAYRETHRPDPMNHTKHYRAFRTSDGFVAVGAGSPASRRRLSAVLKVHESLVEKDPDRFGRLLEQRMTEQPSDYWVSTLRAAEVPVSAVYNVDEMFFDEHVLGEGLIRDYPHDEAGSYRAFGQPIRLSETPMSAGPPAPGLAEHTVAILQELGFADDDIDRLTKNGTVRAGQNRTIGGKP
ncbi:CaiB/BaiF CoA transferase family protein [Cumulibacter soli]|uniref:CaiB/BaiF CoA transferase family protein n=1 Tax=Cumulibacter soli TaxID=2546344 RepID=UPI00141A24CD|nr:CoA transferase [Cumulibacter soli]